jgi:hypothetical protein
LKVSIIPISKIKFDGLNNGIKAPGVYQCGICFTSFERIKVFESRRKCYCFALMSLNST